MGLAVWEWTENDIVERNCTYRRVSGDCARGLDQASPTREKGRSLFRWQHPEVIENANRHEPQRLTESANGSKANRADGQRRQPSTRREKLHRRGRACHSLITHDVASEPPGKASLRLACSLRSLRSALTGPGSDAGPFPQMREWQALSCQGQGPPGWSP